jgi:hypothetical protein
MDDICTICNKSYSSYKSLWTHNKKFHNNLVFQKMNTGIHKNDDSLTTNNLKNDDELLTCKFCCKTYATRQNRWRHEKNCKMKGNIQLNEIKMENNEIKKENKEIKQKLKQLEKMIDSKNVTNINKGTIIKGNVINNIENNIHLELGAEDVKLLSEAQKLKVLKSVNFGEYPVVALIDELYKNHKNRNVKISNLQNNMALKYDGDIEKFKATSKKQVVNEIISVRKIDIKAFFEEYCNTNKITDKTKNLLEKYINKLNDTSEKDSELRKFLNEHKEQIIFILYNITLLEENKEMEI